jgi:hypothetical protein
MTTDKDGNYFGELCITPDNTGYRGEFYTAHSPARHCGRWEFNLVAGTDVAVGHYGPFDLCTNDEEVKSYYFATGAMGVCTTLFLNQRGGDNFGKTRWEVHACGENVPDPGPGPGPVPVDRIAPTTTAAAVTPANANGWNNADVLINFSASDAGDSASGVRGIHVALSGAQTGTMLLPATGGSIRVTAEGTIYVTYFAIDNAGNRETARTLTIKLDKTPPSITGMPAAGCSMWPPNHKFAQVATVSANDNLSGMALFNVNASSNEPVNGKEPDTVITGSELQPRSVQLRKERFGNGKGRIYSIAATASDVAGNIATAMGTCVVPHDQGR